MGDFLDFSDLLDGFVDNVNNHNEGDGITIFYKQISTGEMGRGGSELKEYCRERVMIMQNTQDTIHTPEGKQSKTINISVRTTRGDLYGCYFYFNQKRYKIIDNKNINAKTRGLNFYHYECFEG